MKARIENVSVYTNENIMLVAPEQEMYDFATWMISALAEASNNATRARRKHTAETYDQLLKQFLCIRRAIESNK